MNDSMTFGRPLGWVAEFCPICREISPARLRDALNSQGNPGPVRGLECGVCGFRRWTETFGYLSATPEREGDIEELIRRTNPQVRDLCAARLAFEERIKDGRIDGADRHQALREPLELLAPMIDRFPGGEWMGWGIGLGIVMSVLLFAVSSFVGRTAVWAPLGALGFLLLALVTLVLGIFIRPLWKPRWRARHLRTSIYPMLARSLRPLNPTLDELRSTVEGMRSLGIRPVRHVDPEALHAAVTLARSQVPT